MRKIGVYPKALNECPLTTSSRLDAGTGGKQQELSVKSDDVDLILITVSTMAYAKFHISMDSYLRHPIQRLSSFFNKANRDEDNRLF